MHTTQGNATMKQVSGIRRVADTSRGEPANENTKSRLVWAAAAALGASVAEGATYTAVLTSSRAHAHFGSALGNLSSSTATWSYDDATNLLSQTGGTYNVRFTTAPTTTFFRHSITGLAIGAGGPASASAFTCTEGNFGYSIGASICGNYSFGGNGINQSSSTWGPGTAKSRTLGGDDTLHTWLGPDAVGTQHSVNAYSGFSTVSLVGTTLTLSNATCDPGMGGSANNCAAIGGSNRGYTWTLNLSAPLAIAADDGPVAVVEGVPEVIPVGGNDAGFTDPVTVTVTTPPTKGTIAAISAPGPAAGMTITYVANIGTSGADSFVYNMADSTPTNDSATVTLGIGIDLTTGTTGSVLVNQSFNGETRSADVTLLGANNKLVTSMSLAGIDIRNTSALVGARIYASGGTLIASADVDAPVGEDQTITVPITATLLAGDSYRLAFFVPSSADGNNGDSFDPNPAGAGGFGYVESLALFQVNGGFQDADDVFPTSASYSVIPQIRLSAGAPPPDADSDTIPDAADNCPVTANTDQGDSDADLQGDTCDNCRVLANNSGAAAQCDSDSDGYGNRCDGDVNNNGATNSQDTVLFRQQLGQPSVRPTFNKADINCSGAVNSQDSVLFRQLLGWPPGPSGLVP